MRAHSAAVIAALEAADLAVGLGQKPEGAGTKYAVLSTFGDVEPSSVSEPYGAFIWTGQLMCVGQGPEQAEWVSDRARSVLLGPLSITGRTWISVSHEPGPPLQRDEDVNPPLFWLSETYRILTHPA